MLKKRLLCMVLSVLLALNMGLTALASEEALPGPETSGGAGDIWEAFDGIEGLEVSVEEEPEGEAGIEERAESLGEAESFRNETEQFTGSPERAEAFEDEEELTESQGQTQVSEDETERLTGNPQSDVQIPETEISEKETEDYREADSEPEEKVTAEGMLNQKAAPAQSGTCGTKLKWKITGTKRSEEHTSELQSQR